jgi:putative serine protease PepD
LAIPALTVVLSLAAGWTGGQLAEDDPVQQVASGSPSGAAPVPASLALGGTAIDVGGVLGKLKSSVVSVRSTVSARQGPFINRGEAAGTGVVMDGEGHILTNAHVVEGGSNIEVTLNGETKARKATLVDSDAEADIAVLRVADTSGLVAASFAGPDVTAVGDPVVAIGNALALDGGLTVTEGIISALDRSMETATGTMDGLVQTDAAISSGNSGGPLVNASGQVVGINTAVASSGGDVQASNIGFAISIDVATKVADRLLSA